MTNEEIVKKMDMTLADLDTGGVLNPEQADTFIRKLLATPTLLQQARSVTMNSPQMKINKIGFANRIMRKANTAWTNPANRTNRYLADADRSGPTTEQIQLNSKEVMAEIWLPYDIIENNIEGGNINTAGANAVAPPIQGGFKDTIMALIATRAALDLEELAISGDTSLSGSDPYLGLVDGFLKKSGTNYQVDAAGASIQKLLFKNAMKMLPDQYLRNLPALRHYVSVDNDIEFKDTLAQRETALGDTNLQGYAKSYAYGVPLEPVSLMPNTDAIFTNPQNFIFGIQRQISIEVEKDIRARSFIIVLTAKVDFQIEETMAAVRIKNIGAGE